MAKRSIRQLLKGRCLQWLEWDLVGTNGNQWEPMGELRSGAGGAWRRCQWRTGAGLENFAIWYDLCTVLHWQCIAPIEGLEKIMQALHTNPWRIGTDIEIWTPCLCAINCLDDIEFQNPKDGHKWKNGENWMMMKIIIRVVLCCVVWQIRRFPEPSGPEFSSLASERLCNGSHQWNAFSKWRQCCSWPEWSKKVGWYEKY